MSLLSKPASAKTTRDCLNRQHFTVIKKILACDWPHSDVQCSKFFRA